jgi:hypothetical protein
MATSFSDSVNGSSNTQGVARSRLLTNSNDLREALITRNLYTPDDEYSVSNPTTESKIVDAVNTIVNTVKPFKAFDLRDTVLGRIVTTPTPLTEIGLAMLGVQLAYNASSHISQQTLPVIKVSNLFDGDTDTKLFTKNVDYRVTTKEEPGTFANYIDRLRFWYPKVESPFDDEPRNSDYINNTGTGQLSILFKLLNRNVYKPSNEPGKETNIYHTKSKDIKPELTSPEKILGGKDKKIGTGEDDKKYFNFDNVKFYPYLATTIIGGFKPDARSIKGANTNMINSVVDSTDEYGENIGDFGRTMTDNSLTEYTWSENAQNDWIGDNPVNDRQIKLVWGRSKISEETNAASQKYRGSFGDANSKDMVDIAKVETASLENNFGVRTGLLDYTKNLINATEGGIGDLTRKVFLNNKKLIGFNGSALWKANNSKYAQKSETAGKTGVRQHSVLDQYDRFAKAVRFLGNEHYDGNPNSVIYDSVMPRIHPTLESTGDKKNYINNKNLMFSIENLAVGVFANDSKDGYAIMDDEKGTPVPLCEVGPFNGRVMWFPPYALNIQETATARFEQTMLVGRNEPIYTYMNSDRGGTLTFTLLVDYPEQLRKYRGTDQNRKIAEFFAFGDENYTTPPPRKKKDDEFVEPLVYPEPQFLPKTEIAFSFPNDEPKVGSENTIFDKMYNGMAYEILEDCKTKNGDKTFGINSNIYVINGLTPLSPPVSGKTLQWGSTVDQYSNAALEDQVGLTTLNNTLKDYFSDEDKRGYYEVLVWGGASRLYTEQDPNDPEKGADYNLKLGNRRGLATKKLVEERLKAVFGNAIANKITVRLNDEYRGTDLQGKTVIGSQGDTLAGPETGTAAAIPEEDTKRARFGKILIRRNNKEYVPTNVKKKTNPTPEETRDLLFTKDDTENLCVFEKKTINTGLESGPEVIGNNHYQPVFHSQTPEDFHKRLTFLHQCLRQGAAKRYSTVQEGGEYRARNSVFGRQPFCVLRIGDFFYTKIIIESLNVDYTDAPWDMNPEGFGMQPMMANITLNIKIIGGQSLKGPVDALQNAVSYNYYANSTYSNREFYTKPNDEADNQEAYMKGVLGTKVKTMKDEYKAKTENEGVAAAMNAAKALTNLTGII